MTSPSDAHPELPDPPRAVQPPAIKPALVSVPAPEPIADPAPIAPIAPAASAAASDAVTPPAPEPQPFPRHRPPSLAPASAPQAVQLDGTPIAPSAPASHAAELEAVPDYHEVPEEPAASITASPAEHPTAAPTRIQARHVRALTQARRVRALAQARRVRAFPGDTGHLLLVTGLAAVAGLLVARGLEGSATPAASTPAAAQAAAASANWIDGVPKTLPTEEADSLSLDAREVRPLRMHHQLELLVAAMNPGEILRQLTIRADGTLMGSLVHGTDERTLVTKGEPPATAPAGQPSTAPVLAIEPGEINTRVPAKLLRTVARDGGVAPTTIDLVRSAAIRSGKATWVMHWVGGDGKPATSVYATEDGRKLAASSAALP
ncbi:MAG: hypothetical protein QM679_10165 [Patulibacter sp.]